MTFQLKKGRRNPCFCSLFLKGPGKTLGWEESQVVPFTLVRKFLVQCKLTFKRCGWRLSCSESVNFRKPSFASIIICLDFKIVRSGFTESLYLVCMTRTIINSNKPGRRTQNTYKLELFSNHKFVCQYC